MATLPVKAEPGRPVAIAILAKAPLPGLAKTRLIPHLGADGAADLQGWLLDRTVATALAAGIGPVSLWCAPDTRHPEFTRHRNTHGIELDAQPAGDLGERMYHAVATAQAPHGTLVIGTDCPVLTPAHLQAAAQALQSHDVVITPAEDGGYVMIGLRRPSRVPFDNMPWSTPQLMTQTRQRLAASNLSWFEFDPLWDVDRKEDFERLERLLPNHSLSSPALTNRRHDNEAVALPSGDDI